MSIIPVSNVFGATQEEMFWKWFQINENSIFNFENDREKIFHELSGKMHKIHPDLTFEFTPIRENGKREFVITAGGIKTAFPSVEKLYKSAPNIKRWHFIKFRPRRNPLNNLSYGGKDIVTANVHYKMYKDEEKIGIVLFFDGYNEKEGNIYEDIGYLFLDQALGEYDIETRIGFVEFHGRDSEHYEGSLSLSKLSKDFDAYLENSAK